MACLLAAWAGLAPAGHAGIDQPLVHLGAVQRTEAEALGDSRAEAPDEDVGLGDHPQVEFAGLPALQVRRDRSPVAQQVVAPGFGRGPRALAGPLDADDVGPQV